MFDELIEDYGADCFRQSLAEFMVQLRNPDWSRIRVQNAAVFWEAPFRRVAVYHKIKMFQQDTDGFMGVDGVLDSVHVKPSRKNKRGSIIPGRFDTVLFDNLTEENVAGVIGLCSCYTVPKTISDINTFPGLRVAQIRVIFSIPPHILRQSFPDDNVPTHLAYIDSVHHGLPAGFKSPTRTRTAQTRSLTGTVPIFAVHICGYD